MNQRIEIGKLVIGLAEYYEKQLTTSQLDMYVDDLMEISPVELLQAIRAYRRDPKNVFFPKPAQLIASIRQPDEQRARDAVARILTAISRIGIYRMNDAQAYVGELGWEVVRLQGGWEEVCKSITDENKAILQAQWRELAVSLINKERLGLTGEAPTLQFKPKTSSLESLSGMIQLPEVGVHE